MTTKELIKKHEGLKLQMYKDSVGANTIGVGHNLDANGISFHVAEVILQEDINIAIVGLEHVFKDQWHTLPKPVQSVMIDMMFNLGYPRFSGFKKMIAAVKAGDWKEAAKEAKDSKWCEQLPTRCKDDCSMLLGCVNK